MYILWNVSQSANLWTCSCYLITFLALCIPRQIQRLPHLKGHDLHLGLESAFTLASKYMYFGLSKGLQSKREMMEKISHVAVWKIILVYPWFNLNSTDQSSLLCGLLKMHCTSLWQLRRGILERQNGVAVVQIINMILDTFLYYWKLEFSELCYRQQLWYYLEMLLVLVSCLIVMIFAMLCLLDVLHFVPSLSRGNLFEEWVAAMASLWNESNSWVYSKMKLKDTYSLEGKLWPN